MSGAAPNPCESMHSTVLNGGFNSPNTQRSSLTLPVFHEGLWAWLLKLYPWLGTMGRQQVLLLRKTAVSPRAEGHDAGPV